MAVPELALLSWPTKEGQALPCSFTVNEVSRHSQCGEQQGSCAVRGRPEAPHRKQGERSRPADRDHSSHGPVKPPMTKPAHSEGGR